MRLVEEANIRSIIPLGLGLGLPLLAPPKTIAITRPIKTAVA
ncbi:hypothetical protein [Oceanobacillus jeddahense]|nr:hypothetical protein [Oceanobacillus jeddahense]